MNILYEKYECFDAIKLAYSNASDNEQSKIREYFKNTSHDTPSFLVNRRWYLQLVPSESGKKKLVVCKHGPAPTTRGSTYTNMCILLGLVEPEKRRKKTVISLPSKKKRKRIVL